jgi:basic membrane protein A
MLVRRLRRERWLLLPLVLLAACGSSGGSSSSGSTAAGGATSAAAPSASTGGTAASSGEKTKVALLMTGPVNDGGHNNLPWQGLQKLQDAGGFEVAYQENVPATSQQQVAQQYVDSGYDLIIGNGFEWGQTLEQMAPANPDTHFFVTGGAPNSDPIPPNVGFMSTSNPLFGYEAGALAALMSKSHVVGGVGGADIAPQREIMNAFKLGAEKTVPGTKALVVVTGDFNDAAKGRQAAETMIGNGADVIFHAADSTGIGAMQGAGAGKVMAIGAYTDQSDVAPDAIGTSFLLGLEYAVTQAANAIHENSDFSWGEEWVPSLDKIWSPIWHTETYNPDIISGDTWSKWQPIVEDLKDGTIEVPANDNPA